MILERLERWKGKSEIQLLRLGLTMTKLDFDLIIISPILLLSPRHEDRAPGIGQIE